MSRSNDVMMMVVRSDPIDYIKETLQPMQKSVVAATSGTNHATALLEALAVVDKQAQQQLAESEREVRKEIEALGQEAQRLWTHYAVLNNEHASFLVEALDLKRAIEQNGPGTTSDAYQRRWDALQVQIAAHAQALDQVMHRANKVFQEMEFRAKAMLASPARSAIVEERDRTQHKLLADHAKYHKRMQRNAARYQRRLAKFLHKNEEMRKTVCATARPATTDTDSESSDGSYEE